MARVSSDVSPLVGVVQFASMMGRSRKWARDKLRAWLKVQNEGGPQRVIVSESNEKLLYTTLTVIQHEFLGSVQDPKVTRKLKEHDRDLDFLARRFNELTSELGRIRDIVTARRPSRVLG